MIESAFRTSVCTKLTDKVHRQPMVATFMGCAGTPDTYFDFASDLWVEWKCLDRDDHLPSTIPETKMPNPRQRAWLTRRFNAGGNACCIVGLKLRGRAFGFVLETPAEWSSPPSLAWYQPRLRTAAELAAYILKRVST